MNFHKFRVMMLAAIISQAVACCNPEQKFEVKVKDEGGKPLEGIVCKVGFNLPKKEETGISPYIVSGVTPANGSVERVHDKKVMKLLSIGEPWIGGRR